MIEAMCGHKVIVGRKATVAYRVGFLVSAVNCATSRGEVSQHEGIPENAAPAALETKPQQATKTLNTKSCGNKQHQKQN